MPRYLPSWWSRFLVQLVCKGAVLSFLVRFASMSPHLFQKSCRRTSASPERQFCAGRGRERGRVRHLPLVEAQPRRARATEGDIRTSRCCMVGSTLVTTLAEVRGFDDLDGTSPVQLPCGHTFHAPCAASLHKTHYPNEQGRHEHPRCTKDVSRSGKDLAGHPEPSLSNVQSASRHAVLCDVHLRSL